MEKMASLCLTAEPSPLEAAKMWSRITYSLPYDNQDISSTSVFISECPRLLSSEGKSGRRTWDACLHLATYLVTEGRHFVTNKSILELGAGTGLLSIICAGPLSAAYVLATDGDEDVDKTLVKNIGLNRHLPPAGRRIPLDGRTLEWGSDDLAQLLPSKGGNVLYDTILGADITYSLDSLKPLASTLSGLAEICPKVDILIAATIRNEDTFDIFLAHCVDHGLSVYDVDFRCPRFELQKGLFHSLDPPIRIVRIRRQR